MGHYWILTILLDSIILDFNVQIDVFFVLIFFLQEMMFFYKT